MPESTQWANARAALRRLFAVALITGAALTLAACDSSSQKTEPEPIVVDDVVGGDEFGVDSEIAGDSGAWLYDRNCSVCHGSGGGGGLGPALAGNRNLASSAYVVARIQLGGGGMPPFVRLLSSQEIADVATFIRTSLENHFGSIREDQVELQWHGFRRGMRYGVEYRERY